MAKPLIDVDEDARWRLWRSGGIGGSDIAALIGLSNYASPVSLYYEKIGFTESTADTQRQRIGKRMETVLAAEFHEDTDLYVVGEQTWCEHPEHQWARCTVDGFVADHPDRHPHGGYDDQPGNPGPGALLGTWQCKTDGRFGWPDGVPANIRAQCVWEMGVTGIHHCWLTVMFAGFKIEHHEIPWDDDAQADWEFMLTTADRFWHDNVGAGVCPPMDGHDATTRVLGEIYAVDADASTLLDADDTARALIRDARAAMAMTKAAEAEEVRAKQLVRDHMGTATDLIDGWTTPGPRSKKAPEPIRLATWRPGTRTKVDLDQLRAEAPDLVAKHTTTTPTRTLLVKNTKEA